LVSTAPLLNTALEGLILHRRGKVRDVYEIDDRLLIVATDRISAFDYVLGSGIPDKGKVLTQLSGFWFDRMGDLVPHHLISMDVQRFPEPARRHAEQLRGRTMLVRKTDPVPIECVARGYLSGSGWKDYQASGTVSGVELPDGLQESEQLPAPIFTPSTKAEEGHDEAIDLARAAELVGSQELAERLRDASIAVYEAVAAHARERGVILADTKFEFGFDADGTLTLGDEVCTPDSSRFWPADQYEVGRGQPSFDKQYVRDWASGTGWDKTPPAPRIPDDVVAATRERYVTAYEKLAGEPFSVWLERVA
jgi:phosphoribosylaminoimidazole-succinocarboxamide synthase